MHAVHPLLKVLDAHSGSMKGAAAREAVADLLNLTAEERAQRIPSGQTQTYKHRVGWAKHVAQNSNLVSTPSHGIWEITDTGRKLLAKYPSDLPVAELRLLRTNNRAAAVKGSAVPASDESDTDPTEAAPEERIHSALQEIRGQVATDILERISNGSPEFFEELVLKVLHAMGYGKSAGDIQHTGQSGDGGIDGIISLDKLGLDRVYVQAKKWQSNVGSPEIQKFMGALQLHGAVRGVFITNSGFTHDAEKAAGQAQGKLVLIDGKRLAGLMIDHGVGVTSESFAIPKIDEDAFLEDA